MNADVEKAVERLRPEDGVAGSMANEDVAAWQTIRQALRDQEAEIARLRGKVARYAMREPINSVRVSELACRAMSAESRSEQSEALLSEAWGFMRAAGIDWDDSNTGSLLDRITTHLGATHDHS